MLSASASAAPTLSSEDQYSFVPADGIILPVVPLSAELRAFVKSQADTAGRALLRADEPAPTAKFALFSSDFIKLQLATAKALTLPIAEADFDQKYGTFAKKTKVTECITALKDLNAHCLTFGSPAKLVTEIQSLANGAKPTMLYGQIVWLAQQIANTAETFSFTMKELTDALKSTDSKEARYEILKELLTGEGGLATEAINMGQQATDLRNAILKYLEDMNRIKAPVNTYFSESSDIYKEAVDKNKAIADRLVLAQAELSSVREEYIKYVAAATASSVGVFVFTMGVGWPVSAILGGVLGDLAEKARKRANEVEAEVNSLGVEGRKKTQLVADVSALNADIGPIESYLRKVSDSLAGIASVWTEVAGKFDYIVKNTSPDALKDIAAITQAMRIRQGQEKWALTAQMTSAFTAKAFVEIR
ncbi:hypothetical protein F0P96_18070 [Hymenobacter busanensis]|uniref:Uncharacterized protein n=1 Tax=Hymenobacter busanensis TaxID=2607656 RepID=A0A7L4ZS22_9BACT|nr:hypothetical protein [Hymenobacter busanensis]KAA9327143.1 hypothetical protein F0P96_18070 [Hymenobacter busanensis]QHJ05808.1 hypothetical protein GUY19_00265 [Hymenobacter busanensis]